jgi:hypothetical protein
MSTWEPLLDRLTKLRDTWPAPPWSWDARFAAISSTFAVDQEPAVRASALLAFPRGWTTRSLELAPADMRALAERTGGLRMGQRLLGGDETESPTLFGLWWPWGDGTKVTLRIGILDLATDAEPLPRIRELFGVKA